MWREEVSLGTSSLKIMPSTQHRWSAAAASVLALTSSGVALAFAPTSPSFQATKCRYSSTNTALGVATPPRRKQQQEQQKKEKFGEEGTESSILDRWDGSIPSDEASRRRMASARMTSIIDDGEGHINADLARSIWEWENEHMKEEGGEGDKSKKGDDGGEDFPAARLKFSTRSGLRIVDEVAREMLALTSESASESAKASASDVESGAGGASASYSDLCQEGTIALMRAIAKYDPSMPDPFEVYARHKIYRAMSRAVADTARPLRLPSRVHNVLKAARREADRLRSALEGEREPTLEEIAAAVRVTPDQLRFYGLVGRDAVPVEGTVEIYDPDAPPGDALAFADEDAYETVTGKDEALLHGGEVLAEVLEEEDEWVEPRDKIVAPLRDAIPDRVNHGPDEEVMEDFMRHDVDDLLVRSLDDRELAVIRMRFGLTPDADGTADGKSDHPVYREGMTFTEIGAALGISRQRAAQIEQRALDKLRENYSSVFVEQYLDDDHSAEVSI